MSAPLPANLATPLPRSEFPIVERSTYLNHAAAGVLPASVRAAVEAFVAEHAAGGVLGTYPHDERMPNYRERIGRLIGASGSEIAIVPSTSAGANLVAQSIDWRPGDRVLLWDHEFPANAMAWLALRRRGVEVDVLPAAEGRPSAERLERALKPRTRAVTVSWVAYDDGYRLDLHALSAVAHAAGALLCVDAIQGIGALQLDVRASGIDALYAGAQKWLLGLHGSGLLYVAHELLERFAVPAPGWRSMRDIWAFADYEQPYAEDAFRFEGGTPNYIGALALAECCELFGRCGPAAIETHVLGLSARLIDGLQAHGATLLSDPGPAVRSGIVTFAIEGVDSIELGRSLQRRKIVTTYRPSGVRVSPHGYNTPEEIDALLAALPPLG